MLPRPPQPDPQNKPQVAELKRQLYLAHLKIALLKENLRLVRLRRNGAAAEKLSPQQLALLAEEPGVSEAEVLAEA